MTHADGDGDYQSQVTKLWSPTVLVYIQLFYKCKCFQVVVCLADFQDNEMVVFVNFFLL